MSKSENPKTFFSTPSSFFSLLISAFSFSTASSVGFSCAQVLMGTSNLSLLSSVSSDHFGVGGALSKSVAFESNETLGLFSFNNGAAVSVLDGVTTFFTRIFLVTKKSDFLWQR